MAKKKQHPDPGAGNLWGIDLGGTKIEGVVLRSAQDPEVLFRDRVPTEADQGYEHILEQIHKLAEMMKAALGTGGPCYCGKSGCVERIISGPMLQQYYFKETGNNKPLKDIVALAESKVDPTAQKTMIRLVHFFGKAMSVIINILDPDVIVIGGGVGNIDLLYDRGRDAVKQHVFNDRLDTPIVRPMLGDSAGVFGAAFLVGDAV